jgi:ketosteroid isomerase-like protein
VNVRDPKLTVLLFNEHINRHDLQSLSSLMAGDHLFVDREGNSERSREKMTRAWGDFFTMFPEYRNTFVRLESSEDTVAILGHAYWNDKMTRDPAIWVAKIENDLVAEWRIYHDTDENRRKFLIEA